MPYEVENMIAGGVGYDNIRKHLAECGYHKAEIREKDHPETQDVYIDNLGTNTHIEE